MAVFAAFAVFASLVVYAAWKRIGHDLQLHLPLSPSCVVSADGGAPGAGSSAPAPSTELITFDSTQMANAATIAAVGLRRGVPQRAIVVALATAMQESKLENLAGGDRDSVGLFQQRPSQGWGTAEQIADPRYSSGVFYSSLLKVPGWQKMRVTDAAQAVQRSAHPDAYERWADRAQILASALSGDMVGAVACTVTAEPPSRGSVAARTLAASVKLDWGEVTTAKPSDVVGLALTVRTTKAGWQYAHWLVAHAEERGVRRVRFGDREWTAKDGSWRHVTDSAGAGTGERVLAEVLP
jgi:hypothetical protein